MCNKYVCNGCQQVQLSLTLPQEARQKYRVKKTSWMASFYSLCLLPLRSQPGYKSGWAFGVPNTEQRFFMHWGACASHGMPAAKGFPRKVLSPEHWCHCQVKCCQGKSLFVHWPCRELRMTIWDVDNVDIQKGWGKLSLWSLVCYSCNLHNLSMSIFAGRCSWDKPIRDRSAPLFLFCSVSGNLLRKHLKLQIFDGSTKFLPLAATWQKKTPWFWAIVYILA